MTWETQDVRLAIASERSEGMPVTWRTVPGDTMPGNCLAVTQSVSDPTRWNITHRPSGVRIYADTFPSRSLARAIAVEANAAGDWHRSLDEIANDGVLIAAVRQIASNYTGLSRAPLVPDCFVPDETTGLTRRLHLPSLAGVTPGDRTP